MKAKHVTKLKAALQGEDAVPEDLLYERLRREPEALTGEEAEDLIAEAHAVSAIRWVAFRGWAWGGQPR